MPAREREVDSGDAPTSAGSIPCRRNRAMIWRDSAPSARRMPTSRRRWSTVNVVSPYRPTPVRVTVTIEKHSRTAALKRGRARGLVEHDLHR